MEERSKFFQEVKVIGKGAFGEVILAQDNQTQQDMAVKIIKKSIVTPLDISNIKKEAKLLDQMDHKNIVKFKCILESENEIYLCMELMEGGNLLNLMEQKRKQKTWFSEKEAQIIIKQILEAIAYIHTMDIVHRDIKPAKLNDISLIKLADFGLSTQYNKKSVQRVSSHQCGTIIYMAPEQLMQKQYSRPVDVFACGLIMYMLLSRSQHPIYQEGDSAETYKHKLTQKTID